MTSGDTWASVSDKVFGSPSFGMRIARANGLTVIKNPAPGMALTIPVLVSNVDTHNDHAPYAAIFAKLQGPIQEALNHHHKNLSCMQDTLILAAVFTLAFFVPYALEGIPALVGAMGTMGTAATGAALAGGLSDLSQQLMTDRFLGRSNTIDWGDVVAQIFTGALTGALSKLSVIQQMDFFGRFASLAGANMAEQGVLIEAGVQSAFDPGAMVAFAAQGALGETLKAAGYNPVEVAGILTGAGMGVDDAVDGRSPSWDAVLDSFAENFTAAELNTHLHKQHAAKQPVMRAHHKALLQSGGGDPSSLARRQHVEALKNSANHVGRNAQPKSEHYETTQQMQKAKVAMLHLGVATGHRGIDPRAKGAAAESQRQVQLKQLTWHTRALYDIGKYFDTHTKVTAYINALDTAENQGVKQLGHTFFTEAGWKGMGHDLNHLMHFSLRVDHDALSGHFGAALDQFKPVGAAVMGWAHRFEDATGPERTQILGQLIVSGALMAGAGKMLSLLGDLGGVGNFAKEGAALQASRTSSFLTFSRKATAFKFYLDSGFDPDSALMHLRGVDFSVKLRSVTMKQGSEAVQYYLPRTKEEEMNLLQSSAELKPGNYFAPVGTSGSKLGIYTSGRTLVTFFARRDTQVLESVALPMIDDYSMAEHDWEIETEGGGQQYFSPRPRDWEPKL